MKDYYPPKLNEKSFTCPYCGVYAQQNWTTLGRYSGDSFCEKLLKFCKCAKCDNYSVWHQHLMIFPKVANVPMPNEDLDEGIKELYNQARNIYSDSPRGACALLRLCVQNLCVQLGEKGKDLNTDIKNLVSKGLPVMVQQSLDIVRVVGNNAVHPGIIVIEDNLDMAISLFSLINIIAEKMITEPKELSSLYQSLPLSKLEEIEKRDAK